MLFWKKNQKRLGQTLSQKYRAYSKPVHRKRRPVNPKPIPKISRLNYKTKRTLDRIKKVFILLILLFLIGGSVYFSFFSSTFLIKDYHIEESESEINEEEMKPFLEKTLYQNLFLIKTDELKNLIKENFPEIQSLQIKKNFPDSLKITIIPSPIVANIVNRHENNETKFLINEKGILVKKNTENPNIPYLVIYTQNELEMKKQAIDPEKIKTMIDAHSSFTKIFNIKVIDILYLKAAREARLRTEKVFYIRVDLNQNIGKQLNKLKLALPKLDIYSVPLEYIDLRIPGTNGEKIFFKRK